MSTVFIGGSRQVSRLPAQVKERLENVINSGFRIVVGDANGADKAVQKYLLDASYENVTIFCSGEKFRNNLGRWETHCVDVPKNVKGFEFYAIKDREMAREADFGMMIWDGKSAGTVLNVLRLIRADKKVVLLNVADEETLTFKTADDWERFSSSFSVDLRNDLQKRATAEEWAPARTPQQASFLDEPAPAARATSGPALPTKTEDELEAEINVALAKGDPASVVDALGNIARARGMGNVAKKTGLARESLYRSLGAGGNPEFTTVLKVISSLGLRLTVGKASGKVRDDRT